MKTFRVSHYICDDFHDTSYFFVEDDVSVEKFWEDLIEAKKMYLKDKREYIDIKNRPKEFSSVINNWEDSLTIGEIKKRIDERKKEIKEWDEKKMKYEKTFSSYMRTFGHKVLWELGEEEGVEDIECYWGHVHDIQVNVG